MPCPGIFHCHHRTDHHARCCSTGCHPSSRPTGSREPPRAAIVVWRVASRAARAREHRRGCHRQLRPEFRQCLRPGREPNPLLETGGNFRPCHQHHAEPAQPADGSRPNRAVSRIIRALTAAKLRPRPRHPRFRMSKRLRLRRFMSYPTRRRMIITPPIRTTIPPTILTTATTAGRRCRSRLVGAVIMAAIMVITVAITAVIMVAAVAGMVAGITDRTRQA